MATRKRKDIEPVSDLPSFTNGREFDALSAEEKEKVWNYYDRKIPLSETRPLNAAERTRSIGFDESQVGRESAKAPRWLPSRLKKDS